MNGWRWCDIYKCIHTHTHSHSVIANSLRSHGVMSDSASLPGSSVHGILQARILEWVALPSSRGSSQPRDKPRSPTFLADSLLSEPPGKSKHTYIYMYVCLDLYIYIHTHTHTHTHTKGYYSPMRKKEILPSTTICMKLESIILSEISLTEKDKYCLSLICESKTGKLGETREWSGDYQGLGCGRGFPGGAGEPAYQCRRHKRWGSTPGLERSPGVGNGNPL